MHSDDVKACLVHNADKFSKADVKLEDFFHDLGSWHPYDSRDTLREQLRIGKFQEWCTAPGLKENLQKIQADLLHDETNDRRVNPETKHGSDKPHLQKGMQIQLNKSSEELKELSQSWKPGDATMLRHVCFVGPGEEQLHELDRIAKGRHWIEFGILQCGRKMPRKEGACWTPKTTETTSLETARNNT